MGIVSKPSKAPLLKSLLDQLFTIFFAYTVFDSMLSTASPWQTENKQIKNIVNELLIQLTYTDVVLYSTVTKLTKN